MVQQSPQFQPSGAYGEANLFQSDSWGVYGLLSSILARGGKVLPRSPVLGRFLSADSSFVNSGRDADRGQQEASQSLPTSSSSWRMHERENSQEPEPGTGCTLHWAA